MSALRDGPADLRLSPICLFPVVGRWKGDVSQDLVSHLIFLVIVDEKNADCTKPLNSDPWFGTFLLLFNLFWCKISHMQIKENQIEI